MNCTAALSRWIDQTFGQAGSFPDDSCLLDNPPWENNPELLTTLIAETFERSGELFAALSDEQLAQGFWLLLREDGSDLVDAFIRPAVPLPLRLRLLRSFVPLFEQTMAARCPPGPAYREHVDQASLSPLNGPCFMWWDVCPVGGCPDLACTEFADEVLVVLGKLLAIPHDACRESALHGVGEWCVSDPRVVGLVDDFLARTPGLCAELVLYAQRARIGMV